MVNAPISFRRFRLAPIALVVAAAFAPVVLAQEADRDLYAAARALEQTARVSLDDVHTAVAAYLLVPKRYPASSFSDDALWKAGHLSLDAFTRFGRTGDRDAGQRALKRLVTGYPGSKLAKQVPAALAGAPPPAVAAAAPVSAPVIEPPPAPVPVATTSTVPATPPATPPAMPSQAPAPATPRARPATTRATGSTATIRSIRRTVLPDAVRIIIELDGEVAFQQERIAGPDRVFLDLSPSRAAPPLQDQTLRFNSDSDVVRQVRLGRHENRTTRIVLDAGGVGTYSVYALYNPYRLVIDCVRAKPPEVAPPPLLAAKRLSPAWGRQLPSAAPLNAVALREAAIVPKAAPVPPPARTPAPPPAAAAPVVAAAAAAPVATPAAAPIVGPPLPGPPTVVSADLPGIQAGMTPCPQCSEPESGCTTVSVDTAVSCATCSC